MCMQIKLPYSTTGMMLHLEDDLDVEVLASSIESMPKSDKTEDEIVLDATGRKNGRGAYICKSRECLEKARKNHGLERSLKAAIPDEVYDSLEKEFDSIEE